MAKQQKPTLADVGFMKKPEQQAKAAEKLPEPKLEYNTVSIPAGPGKDPVIAKIPAGPKPTHSVVKLLVNYHPVLAYELIESSAPTNISDTLKAGSTVKLDAEEAAGLIADGRAEAI